MKVTTFGKAGLSLATAATLTLGLGVTAANASGTPLTASQEDPTTSTYLGGAGIGQHTLVGTGSDTIQDVEYGIAQDLGTYTGPDGTTQYANIASWTATGTTAMSYRSGGHPAVATAHPNGSGAGFTTLKESLGVIATGVDGVAAGDVDYSRASGFQGNEQLNQTGVVTEIPFAIDAISFAAPANSPFLKTNGGAGLKLADLADIYAGVDKYIDTTTGALSATAAAGTEPIQAFLPKPGSGSRQFFLQQLNKVNSAVPIGSDKGDTEFPASYPGTTSPYIGSQMPDGTSQVVEHDATVLTSAPAGVAAIAPFSAAKFIGYHNGKIADPDTGKVAGTDYVLVPFDSASGAVLPYTGDASTTAALAPNPAYKAQGAEGNGKVYREVFNIIPTAAVKNPNANVKYRALYDTFVGPYSKFCADTATIEAYGFAADSNCGNATRTANAGGSDTSSGYSTSTVTVSNTPAVAGKSTVVTASVQSVSNGGGSVTITVNGHEYTGSIPAGSTSVNFTVPTPAAGSIAYGGGANDGFTPNLAGVASAPVPTGTITVAKATPVVKATAAKVSHLKIGSATVTVTATGLVPTGTVNVRVKTTSGVLKLSVTKSLSSGKAVVSFGKVLPKGTYYVWVSYSGNSNVNAKALTRLATLTVY
ncbi:MAG: hypothetical protein ACTHOG_11450 [Marmoricola sp.]